MVKQKATWLASSLTILLLSLSSPSSQFKLFFLKKSFSPVSLGERECKVERETDTGSSFLRNLCSLK